MSSKLPKKQQSEHHEPFGQLMKSMNQFFQERPVRGLLQNIDNFFLKPFPLSAFSVDVIEKENEHIVTAELPGVNKEQIDIHIFENHITISVNNKEIITEEDENNHVFVKKQSFGHASKTISLPQPIKEHKVKASYKDGLLQVRIPKEKGKRISID